MDTARIDLFVPGVAVNVPDASEPLIEQMVRRAAQEFCHETNIWSVWSDAESVSAGDFPYQIPIPSGARLVRIQRVQVDGADVSPLVEDDIEDLTETGTTAGGYSATEPGQLSIYPVPENSVSIRVKASFAPTTTGTVVPSVLWQEYATAIESAATGLLLRMPGRAWTNLAAAHECYLTYASYAVRAQSRADRSFVNGPRRVSLLDI